MEPSVSITSVSVAFEQGCTSIYLYCRAVLIQFWLDTWLDKSQEPEIHTQEDITPTNSDDEERAPKGLIGVFNLLQDENNGQEEQIVEAVAHDQTHEKLLDMISSQPKVCSSQYVAVP